MQHGNPEARRNPWSVDRYGRLLAGASLCASTALGLLCDPRWHATTLLGAALLALTALTGQCAIRNALLRLGAKEREDLFYPGGGVRPVPQSNLPRTRAAQEV